MSHILVPSLVTALREGYTLKDFSKDLTAGIVVGVLALPMSIAFAIASGARPEQGLYTAIVAGILGGMLSGSRMQISGPTGAFVILVADTIGRYGYDGLAIATMIAGVILIAMGFARFGAAIKFVPYPVIVGFTTGIALLIFSSQVRDFTGMKVEALPTHFVDKWTLYFHSLHLIDVPTLVISLSSVVIVVLWPKVSKVIPGALVAIVLSTVVVKYFNIPVETIGGRYGIITTCFPCFTWPTFSLDRVTDLISPGIAIALLAGIESLLSAVVADGMTGRRHRSDMELISQGVANIGSALCGGIPATGAISRTAANIKSGARTPIASIVHAFTLLLALLFLGEEISMIPLATLSAILIVIAYNMSEWRHFLSLLRSPLEDVSILLVTFLLTVLVDLVTAIEVGILLAAFIFINRIAQASRAEDFKVLLSEEEDPRDYEAMRQLEIPEEIAVYQIYGSLFFAAAEKFKIALEGIRSKPKVLILRMRHVLNIDATGLHVLTGILNKAKKDDTLVVLSGVRPELYEVLERGGLVQRIGKDNFQKDIWASVEYAKHKIGKD